MRLRLKENPKALNISKGRWNAITIQRFWDYISTRTDLYPDYFSFQVGEGLVNFLKYTNRFRTATSVLEYGCGPGFLVEHLLDTGLNVAAVDASMDSVKIVNCKFKERKNWLGALIAPRPTTPFSNKTFDVVTCIETLEHLMEDTLDLVVTELFRLLKPGGIALITTPNNEDLVRGQIYCPFCQTEFHKVQHVRSFSPSSMQELLDSYGFNVVFCEGINLWEFQQSLSLWECNNVRSVYRWVRNQKNTILDALLPKPFPNGRKFTARIISGPHLCALVERPF